MTTEQQIRNFLELLDSSGFPDDRKQYWLEKIGGGHSSPDDEENFVVELRDHLQTLNTAIDFTEAQIADDQAKVEALETSVLPQLQELAREQPAFNEQESARHRKDILGEEKQMMTEVEGIRHEKQDADIDAIRKKLLS